MCLIAVAWKQHPKFKLVAVANRDEFYDRVTLPAHFWAEYPDLLAGKDLKAGGTWMGVSTRGKWTALTNYRDMRKIKHDAPSRGMLTLNFLKDSLSPAGYLDQLKPSAHLYNGFNLLCGNLNDLYYFSNVTGKAQKLEAGLYGLSNHLLDTPWPKVTAAKAILKDTLSKSDFDPGSLMEKFYNSEVYSDDQLPDTGLDRETERYLSAVFIRMKDYGSRSSTILMADQDNHITLIERSYHKGRQTGNDNVFRFKADVV